MEDVVVVHELHIWAITIGKVLLACHVKIRSEADANVVLDKVIDYIKRVYNIGHNHCWTKSMDGFLKFLVSTFGLVVNIIMALLLGHDHGHGHDGHGHGHRHEHGHDGHRHGHGHGYCHSHGFIISNHHDAKHEKVEHHYTHDHTDHHNDHHSKDEHHHDQQELTQSFLDESKTKKKNQCNINVHGAYLHVLGDSSQSIQVMIEGARMPCEIDATKIERGLLDMEDVVVVHELDINYNKYKTVSSITHGHIQSCGEHTVKRAMDA
ncbi:hypothetical protein V8G54_008607 [Vigna mungo]|uniref:Uncharacterized protein n=1 Tax=Vigna mungo TaxID=3915 RepID=A0AAQ3P463_VIGMU